MSYTLTFEIPTAATDANRILGVNRFVKHAIFKKIKNEIIFKTSEKKPEAPLERFLISITRHGIKTLDYDNLIGSLKPYLDGLTMAGIIKDDSWQFIQHIDVRQVPSKEKKLVISVRENE
jgi:Holliday junction resolvase RusA-like endonuclease